MIVKIYYKCIIHILIYKFMYIMYLINPIIKLYKRIIQINRVNTQYLKLKNKKIRK